MGLSQPFQQLVKIVNQSKSSILGWVRCCPLASADTGIHPHLALQYYTWPSAFGLTRWPRVSLWHEGNSLLKIRCGFLTWQIPHRMKTWSSSAWRHWLIKWSLWWPFLFIEYRSINWSLCKQEFTLIFYGLGEQTARVGYGGLAIKIAGGSWLASGNPATTLNRKSVLVIFFLLFYKTNCDIAVEWQASLVKKYLHVHTFRVTFPCKRRSYASLKSEVMYLNLNCNILPRHFFCYEYKFDQIQFEGYYIYRPNYFFVMKKTYCVLQNGSCAFRYYFSIIYVTKKMKTPDKIDISYKIWNISKNKFVCTSLLGHLWPSNHR